MGFGLVFLFFAWQDAPIVRPGLPGTAGTVISPSDARTNPRTPSEADIHFMQGMIMHHGQAVEMTNLLRTRSKSPRVRSLGQRISISQTDEMKYMKQWLQDRGLPTEMPMDHAPMGMDHMGMKMDAPMTMMMPGMLTAAQMKALEHSTGARFDHLFLTGMIQHHTGALTMVQELFDTPGAAQDNVLYDFATDVDNTQQAEINIMKGILKEKL